MGSPPRCSSRRTRLLLIQVLEKQASFNHPLLEPALGEKGLSHSPSFWRTGHIHQALGEKAYYSSSSRRTRPISLTQTWHPALASPPSTKSGSWKRIISGSGNQWWRKCVEIASTAVSTS